MNISGLDKTDLEQLVDTSFRTIDRIWKALEIETYEQSKGKELSEIISDLKKDNDRFVKALNLMVESGDSYTYRVAFDALHPKEEEDS